MRIIAGAARGTRLKTLDGEDTRPTLERVKEAMFSPVHLLLPGARVLDLFAGSGQLGLEALSRGAAHCVFVDTAADACGLIRENAAKAGFADRVKIIRGDAAGALRRITGPFDLVLLDPPYRRGLLPALLPAVAAVCAPGAMVLCESERDAALPEEAGGLRLCKQYRYGTVAVSRYELPREDG